IRAAVAIRDDVPPYQKWGTKAFTSSYLTKYYAKSYYITQTNHDDGRNDFITDLRSALTQYEYVDIFLLAHSNTYVDWVRDVDPHLRRKIRLVYNTGCNDASQAEQWLHLGANTYIAPPGLSQSPLFYFFFLRRWTMGYNAGPATAQS